MRYRPSLDSKGNVVTATRLDTVLSHGTSLHQSSRWAEAVEHWKVASRAFPDEPMIFVNLGLALFSSGYPADAERCFAFVREKFPDNPWGFFARGLLLEARHQ